MGKTIIDVSTRTFVRFWGVILGIAVVGLLLWKASGALAVLGIALFLAIAINPLVRKIDHVIPGKNRTLATALAYILVVGVVATFLSIAVPAVINETVRFVSVLPGFVEESQIDWGVIDSIGQNFGIANVGEMITSGLASFSQNFVANFGGAVLGSVASVGLFVANLILVLVLAFLMLIEGPRILNWIWKLVGRFFKSPEDSALAKSTATQMTDVMGKFVSGQLTVSTINWGLTTLALVAICLIFGVDVGLALPFGMITALFSLIPLFGSLLGGVLVSVLLCFNGWAVGLAFLVYYLIYAQFEGNIIYPKVQSAGLQLPALAVLAAVTVGIYMFGILGALIAVPIVACIKVILTNYTNIGNRRE